MNPDKSKKITGKVLLIMKNVIIKQTILGRGMPKICAPLVEKDYESLIHQAASFTEQPVDIAEWRADWFDSILEPDTLDQVLPGLESALKDIPLLFTFRTQREGGHLSAPLPASPLPGRTRHLLRPCTSGGFGAFLGGRYDT